MPLTFTTWPGATVSSVTPRSLVHRLSGAVVSAAFVLVGGLPSSVPALAPAASASASVSARAPAVAACKPSISHVSSFAAVEAPDVTIRGKCFGTGHPFTAGDSIYFRVTDVGPNGTLSEVEHATVGTHSWWSACSSRVDVINGSPNGVKCTIGSWSNTAITFVSFTGNYYGLGSYSVKKGDKLVIQVWNHQTGAGPAYGFVTAAGGRPAPVKAGCQPAITHVGAFKAGANPDVSIDGSCFGLGGSFSQGDSAYFRISDLGPTGSASQIEHVVPNAPHTWWNACSSRTDLVNGSPNGVTCTVSNWTNTSMTLVSLGGYYGKFSYSVRTGDKVAIQIWNAQKRVRAGDKTGDRGGGGLGGSRDLRRRAGQGRRGASHGVVLV